MLEVLQYYTSGFWVWLGLTIGLAVVLKLLVILVVCSIGALRGSPVNLWNTTHRSDVNE